MIASPPCTFAPLHGRDGNRRRTSSRSPPRSAPGAGRVVRDHAEPDLGHLVLFRVARSPGRGASAARHTRQRMRALACGNDIVAISSIGGTSSSAEISAILVASASVSSALAAAASKPAGRWSA